MKKKGFMRTIEGALAIFILLSYVSYVMPHAPIDDSISESNKNFVMMTLENLDKNKILENNMIGNTSNLTQIRDSLKRTIPHNLNFTISIIKANTTSDSIFSEESYNGTNITYFANNTYFRNSILTLIFDNASNPKIYANEKEIYTHTSIHPEHPVRLDLTTYTIEGNNNIEIQTLNNATIEYVLIVNNEEILSTLPQNTAIGTVTYMLSGKESYFQPTILNVYLWNYVTT